MEYGESIKKTVMVCLPNLWCSEFLNISEMCFLKFFNVYLHINSLFVIFR